MRAPHKLTHPLGPTKAGSTRVRGATLQPSTAPAPAPSKAAPSGAMTAVKSLQTPVSLAKLAALASNTEQRSVTSGR